MDIESIRLLAEQERDMDTSTVQFAVLDGQRIALIPDVADELGIKTGQTISHALFGEILKANIAHIQARIVMSAAQER